MRAISARSRLRPVLQELEVRIVPVQEHGLVWDLAAKSAHRYGTLCESKLWGVLLSRLNLLAAIVLSCFFGHISVLS